MDQASTLRKLMVNRSVPKTFGVRPLRVISVTSGKGGVGKTNVVANLAVQMQKAGKKVLILDGDFGLANLNIVLGLDAKYTLADVLRGEKTIKDILVNGPHGVKLIPASSGILSMTQLSVADRSMLTDHLESSQLQFDVLLIDTGAGIDSDVAYLNAAASEVFVVATPEPTSVADAYALMKVMSQEHNVKNFKLIVNMVSSSKEAMSVYNQLISVADKFLNIRLEFLGHISDDKKVNQAVMARKVVSEAWPDAIASRCFEEIAQRVLEHPVKNEITGNLQFFWKNLLSEACI
ncbi:MAG: MinD/ParA family protein [Bacteriovoracia bacterium]